MMQAAEAPDLGRPDSRAYERKPSSSRRSLFGNPASGYPGGKSTDAKSTESRYQDGQNAGNSYSYGRNAASQTTDGRKPAGRKSGSSSSILSRAAGLLILLVLCGIGVTSINRYNDMKEAGNLFADAPISRKRTSK